MYIKLNKIQSKILAWVKRAVSKDTARPSLTGIHVDNNLVGSDGYRLHAVKVETVLEEWDVIYYDQIVDFGKVRVTGENIVEPEQIDGSFPDYAQIMPSTTPEFEIAVNPKYLVEALRGLDEDKAVRLAFHGKSSPVEFYGKMDDNPVYGLIMPMDYERMSSELNWRPE